MPPPDVALALLNEAERWLSPGRSWRRLHFSPVLRRQYDNDTRRGRARTSGLISLAGATVAMLLYPVLNAAVPDLHRSVIVLFLGLAVPLTFVASLVVLLNPPPLVREALLSLPTVVDAAVLTYLFRHTAHSAEATDLYIVGIVMTLIFACITLQLRFGFAAAVTAFVMGIYALDISSLRAFDPHLGLDLILVTATAAAYILLGNWRLHVDQQRNYVLMLRERLRQRDLSVRNRELDQLVRQDSLTGLANRRTYDSWISVQWAQAAAIGRPLGLVIIDIDFFKLYNDYYGHAAGDTCLQAVARCLRDQSRGTTDQVARIGGEEFAVLLPGLSPDLCGDIAERLRAAVAGADLPHLGAPPPRRVTVSCGAASFTTAPGATPGNTHADLFAAADAALYRAKEAGRNRVCIADQPARQAAAILQPRDVPDTARPA